MKLIAPDYYKDFNCIAGECRHSCCIGWEIDIDDKTYEYYKQLGGELGERLKAGIEIENGVPHFVLTQAERCPFLNDENLCDIILDVGEKGLCQICDDHPRFRNFYLDRTEIGLGLCCEAAGQLILGRKDKIKLIELEGGTEEADKEEKAFFEFREGLFDILRNREKTIDERISEVLQRCAIELPQISYERWAKFYTSLERLDDAWSNRLEKLKKAGNIRLGSEWETAFEQLMMYFLYRHLPDGLDDGRIAERTAFAALSVHIIKGMFSQVEKNMDNLVEIARQYSSEIEYCEDNIETLLGLLEQY